MLAALKKDTLRHRKRFLQIVAIYGEKDFFLQHNCTFHFIIETTVPESVRKWNPGFSRPGRTQGKNTMKKNVL